MTTLSATCVCGQDLVAETREALAMHLAAGFTPAGPEESPTKVVRLALS